MKMRSAIRPNRIKEARKEGRIARGFHINFSAPLLIEQLGVLPFDFVYLDAEHGMFEMDDVIQCCRAAELSDLTVVCRVSKIDANQISQYLNAGVQAIIVPHVNDVIDARAAVDACFMEPLGHRPNGGSRGNWFWHGVDDLGSAMAGINENIMLAVQLESAESIQNLDEILKVEGIDFYIIGKNDLSQSLGYPRLKKGFHEAVIQIVNDMETKIRSAGGLLKDDIIKAERVKNFAMQGAIQFLGS